MTQAMNASLSIGVMDSGAGGISVLKAAKTLMGNERFIYLGDTLHSPYGERSFDEIKKIALDAASMLVRKGIKALVVACNTATASAIEDLRATLDIPVIGVEPALKPACAAFPGGAVIAVMATPATLSLHKFAALKEKFALHVQVESLPCPGLSKLVEQCEANDPRLLVYLRELFAKIDVKPDAVVIGCTHYSFIHQEIRQILGEVPIFDGAYSTAVHLKNVLNSQGLLNENGSGEVEFLTTGPSSDIELFKAFFMREIRYV